MNESKLYDFAGTLKRETANAYLINDGDNDHWFPKSLTEDNRDGTFTIPSWLAVDKGIV